MDNKDTPRLVEPVVERELNHHVVNRVWFSTSMENPEDIVLRNSAIRYARWFHGSRKTYGYFSFHVTTTRDVAELFFSDYEMKTRPMLAQWETGNQMLVDLAEGLCPGASSIILEIGEGPERRRYDRPKPKAFPVCLI